MNSAIGHALIEPRDIADLSRVIKSPDRRFTALVGAARLHPGRDLRGLDLGPIRIGPEEDVAGYDFSGCLMRGAVLCGVDLRRARFDGCDLSGADLRGARYRAAQMKTAQREDWLTGNWPDRPASARAPVALDPVADAIQTALRKAGDDVDALEDTAHASYDTGRYAIAEALYAIAMDWHAERDGPEHAQTLVNHHNMITSMLNQGHAAEAEAAFRALLPIRERVQGAEHPDVLTTRHALARAMLDQGRAAEAEAAFRALLPIEERVKGAEHPDVLTTRYKLARAMLDQGRAAEAAQLLDAVAGSNRVGEMVGHHRAQLALQRARAADALGRRDEGDAFLAEAEAHMKAVSNRDHYVWRAITAYRATRQEAEAEAGIPLLPTQL